MNMINTFKNYWKSIAIIAFILHLSFAPPSEFKSIPTFENEDKLVHFLMYAFLTSILIYEYRRAQSAQKVNSDCLRFILLCIAFPTILGGIIEILQPLFFFPRTASWLDWLSDSLGVLAGWLALKMIYKKN
jgi:VanZ family protein